MNRSQLELNLANEYSRTGRFADIGKPVFLKELARQALAHGVATQADMDQISPADDLRDKRKMLEKRLRDQYAADPSLRPQTGGRAFQQRLTKLYQDNAADIAADGGGGAGLLAGASEALGGVAVLSGIGSSVRSGAAGGRAIAGIAQGLLTGVTASSSGLTKVGEAILGAVLAPLGKTGSAISGAAGGAAQALVAALSGAGALGVAGVKLGAGLVGGIVGGITAGGGAIAGAVLGLLTGGGAGGAVIGAGIGVSLASFLVGSLTSVLSSLGGALGQALAGIGEAAGKMLGSIGDALSSVKDTLNDLIETGAKFAAATLTTSRTGNLSLGAAAGVASLSSVLGLGPGGLSGIYSGFGEMSQYRASRLGAFGVSGATGTDPLGDISASARAYAGLDPIRRQLLVQGGFGGDPAIGNLFALNALSPGIADRAIGVARRTALSPQETVNNANLSLDLTEAQAQIDRLKTKLLADLMPALTAGLGLASRFFNQNESKIVGGLTHIGEFLYVRFPSMLQQGLTAVLTFGQQMAAALPKIFAVAQNLLIGLVQWTQKVAGNIGKAPLAHQLLGDDAANALTGYSKMSLKDLGIGTDYQQSQLAVADRRRKQAQWLTNSMSGNDNLNPVDWKQALFGDTRPMTADQMRAKRDDLLRQADAAQNAARQGAPGLGGVTAFSQNVQQTLAGQKSAVSNAFNGSGLGTGGEAARQQNFLQMLRGYAPGPETGTQKQQRLLRDNRDTINGGGGGGHLGTVTVEVKEHKDAVMRISAMSATQSIRAIQRSGV